MQVEGSRIMKEQVATVLLSYPFPSFLPRFGKSQYKDGVGKGIGGHDLPQLRDNPRR